MPKFEVIVEATAVARMRHRISVKAESEEVAEQLVSQHFSHQEAWANAQVMGASRLQDLKVTGVFKR